MPPPDVVVLIVPFYFCLYGWYFATKLLVDVQKNRKKNGEVNQNTKSLVKKSVDGASYTAQVGHELNYKRYFRIRRGCHERDDDEDNYDLG